MPTLTIFSPYSRQTGTVLPQHVQHGHRSAVLASWFRYSAPPSGTCALASLPAASLSFALSCLTGGSRRFRAGADSLLLKLSQRSSDTCGGHLFAAALSRCWWRRASSVAIRLLCYLPSAAISDEERKKREKRATCACAVSAFSVPSRVPVSVLLLVAWRLAVSLSHSGRDMPLHDILYLSTLHLYLQYPLSCLFVRFFLRTVCQADDHSIFLSLTPFMFFFHHPFMRLLPAPYQAVCCTICVQDMPLAILLLYVICHYAIRVLLRAFLCCVGWVGVRTACTACIPRRSSVFLLYHPLYPNTAGCSNITSRLLQRLCKLTCTSGVVSPGSWAAGTAVFCAKRLLLYEPAQRRNNNKFLTYLCM